MAITFFAPRASNCDKVPSPAPRSAITMAGNKPEQRVRQSLPRPPGNVGAPKLTRQLVKILGRFVFPLAQRQSQGSAVAGGFRQFPLRGFKNRPQRRDDLWTNRVKNVLADSAISGDRLALE